MASDAQARSEAVVAEGYDRMGMAFPDWNDERAPDARRWFLGEVLARLGEGSDVLELGCGPGTDAEALSADRRYVGVDSRRGSSRSRAGGFPMRRSSAATSRR